VSGPPPRGRGIAFTAPGVSGLDIDMDLGDHLGHVSPSDGGLFDIDALLALL
jgi:hypothetical protein